MIRSIEKSGKTAEDALKAALEELGLTRDDVSVEILTRPRSGFFGIGAVQAKIRVEYDDGKPEPKAPKAPRAPRPEKVQVRSEKSAEPRAEKPAPKQPAPKAAPAAGDAAAQTESFLRGLLERMGVECTVAAVQSENGRIDVRLDGDNMGAVIGRRGETLDAIQHLVNYAVNRGSDKHAHINVDAEDYRSKREESLVHLANKMAAKVLKYKRSMALEPMNSYERHVIHAALQDVEGVSTSSTGTEPNRRVVVNYERAPGEAEEPRPRRARPAPRGDRPARRERPAPKAETAPETEEPKAAPVQETLPPDFPEGYEPPTKNKPQSREWC